MIQETKSFGFAPLNFNIESRDSILNPQHVLEMAADQENQSDLPASNTFGNSLVKPFQSIQHTLGKKIPRPEFISTQIAQNFGKSLKQNMVRGMAASLPLMLSAQSFASQPEQTSSIDGTQNNTAIAMSFFAHHEGISESASIFFNLAIGSQFFLGIFSLGVAIGHFAATRRRNQPEPPAPPEQKNIVVTEVQPQDLAIKPEITEVVKPTLEELQFRRTISTQKKKHTLTDRDIDDLIQGQMRLISSTDRAQLFLVLDESGLDNDQIKKILEQFNYTTTLKERCYLNKFVDLLQQFTNLKILNDEIVSFIAWPPRELPLREPKLAFTWSIHDDIISHSAFTNMNTLLSTCIQIGYSGPEISKLIDFIRNHHAKAYKVTHVLPDLLELRLPIDDLIDRSNKISMRCGEYKNGLSTALAFFARFEKLTPEHRDSFKDFLELITLTNDYNRGLVFKTLLNHNDVHQKLGSKNFITHFRFYLECFRRHPKSGYNILEGLLDATLQGSVPDDISGIQQNLLTFIDRTKNFSPAIYKIYCERGEILFQELDEYSEAILANQMSQNDMHKIIETYSKEFLLGIIQMTSPTSGSSFVSRVDQIRLMRHMLEAGDKLADIPESWRMTVDKDRGLQVPVASQVITQGEWQLQSGTSANPEISTLFEALRNSAPSTHNDADLSLRNALIHFLQATGSDEKSMARQHFEELLFHHVGQDRDLSEKINFITNSSGYVALTLLEDFFLDNDCLPQFLMNVLQLIPDQEFAGQLHKQTLVDHQGQLNVGKQTSLIRALNAASKQKIESERLMRLGKILRNYEDSEILQFILTNKSLLADKKDIERLLGQATMISRHKVVDNLLSNKRELIAAEKAKYEFNRSANVLSLSLRAVKGPAFGLHGLTSGVCTASDMKLWNNPNFKLFAIVNETSKQISGYVHVFEIEIDGKKYLTLPGINPSPEFLATTDAQQLFNIMMSQICDYAKIGGYEAVYIPTSANIHSNRSAFQKIIASQYKDSIIELEDKNKALVRVKWNSEPSPYPFTKVYVAWRKH